jgi:hypothetical protein
VTGKSDDKKASAGYPPGHCSVPRSTHPAPLLPPEAAQAAWRASWRGAPAQCLSLLCLWLTQPVNPTVRVRDDVGRVLCLEEGARRDLRADRDVCPLGPGHHLANTPRCQISGRWQGLVRGSGPCIARTSLHGASGMWGWRCQGKVCRVSCSIVMCVCVCVCVQGEWW